MIRANLTHYGTDKQRDALRKVRDAEMDEFNKKHAKLGVYQGANFWRDPRKAAVEAVREAQIRCKMTPVDEAVRAVREAQARCAVK